MLQALGLISSTSKEKGYKPDMVAHACNFSTSKAQAGESRVLSWFGLHSKSLSQ
jgi:hypothetical protein